MSETPDVSRETPPPHAAGVFASRLELAEQYAELLATDGVVRGLIGPREVPRIWDRHIMNSAVVVPRLPQDATVADVGTGAGLPGLVWAIARTDIQMTLIEPLLRRTSFLEEAVEKLGLDNVEVLRARAEEVHTTYDVVTARAVAGLDKLGRWCMPLVRPGGVLLAMKGRSAADEVASATATLHRLGATSIVVTSYDNGDVPTTVVEVSK
ncbi:16S rRNA (guanine(527)-N(7))-methyltransferase RsmG [Aeromicrobium chenweiae]|uniref:Ribosomal RNA small subunit methyltransferase G n=1 Tax=Aeromicrobium chenweiae TaxID=2079793 RepID=A0A2S0WRT2_9ACTN|nr:16S rRNA (guanine(527)-N(7))-methyltransferase RsmG [Aeromicrobium chenweiae]AWB93954.1 16S rRNA (guanine(527)-N(7))-methyltransferase RsmG [Aeromicrobium chenweiae]TGN31001.1 16S rRNA (guanine(527)-N(7))-methyltransferase RsmG [Aeromicrobium chenweiae]